MAYDVFISYSTKDLALAEKLFQRMDKDGFKVWFDKARLKSGFNWYLEIEEGCENSRIILPVLTPNWKNSEWTKYETYGSEAVIPLIFEGEWGDVSTPPLERFQAERIYLSSDESAQWSRLYSSIEKLLAQPSPEKASRISSLRYRPNDYFTGREKELLCIHEELHCHPRTTLTQGRVRAITAMGGVGKTTLVRQYAEKFWRCYPQIFWIDCRNGIEAEFTNLFDLLYPNLTNTGINPREKSLRALQKLETPDIKLLIMDNAEDEISTQAWIPKTGGCYSLITSRFANWSPSIQTFHLYVLNEEPAIQFLINRSGRTLDSNESSACKKVAEKMGYLPLALEQAAAYITQQGEYFGFNDYLHLYEESTMDLLNIGALGSTFYPDSVITTWKSTIDKITSGARTLLKLLSAYSATPVPIKLFTSKASLIGEIMNVIEESDFPSVNINEIWVRNQIAQLRAYSMVNSDGQTMWIHPLVQTVQQLWLAKEEFGKVVKSAMDLFTSFAPVVSRRFDMVKQWRLLFAHAECLFSHSKDLELSSPPDLIRGLSYVLYDEGKVDRALELALLSLPGRRRLKNLNACSDLICIQKIANMLNKVNHRGFAEIFLRHAVRGLTNSLGKRNQDTLSAMADLANVLADKGKSEEARVIFQKTLLFQQELIGKSEPETLITLIGLGSVYYDLRDFVKAEKILSEAVLGFENRNDASEDADTGGAHVWLAHTLVKQEKWEEAIQHFKRGWEVKLKVLGPIHPDTLIIFNDLLYYVQLMGDLETNKQMFLFWLTSMEKSTELIPPKIITDINNLAKKLEDSGDWDGAECLYKKVINIRSDDIVILGNYAFFLQNKRFDWNKAEGLYQLALSIDPNDDINQTNFAGLCLVMGNRTETEKHLRTAWNILSGKINCYSVRIFFLRASLAALNNQNLSFFLGQLKMLFDQGIKFEPSFNISVMEFLRQHLSAEIFELFNSIYSAINETNDIDKLKNRPDWKCIVPVSLDVPWPL